MNTKYLTVVCWAVLMVCLWGAPAVADWNPVDQWTIPQQTVTEPPFLQGPVNTMNFVLAPVVVEPDPEPQLLTLHALGCVVHVELGRGGSLALDCLRIMTGGQGGVARAFEAGFFSPLLIDTPESAGASFDGLTSALTL